MRDLRGAAGSLYTLVAGIAVGVAVIAAFGSLAGTVSDDVRDGARAAVGGDVSLRLFHEPADTEQRAFLETAAGYSEVAELRVPARRVDGSAATLVELKAVDARYPLYGTVALEPPQPLDDALGRRGGVWGAAADPALLEALGLEPGDPLQFGPLTVAVRARLAAEPGRGVQGFALGPQVLVARAALEGTDLASPGSPVYWYNLVRLAPGADSGAWVVEAERRFPEAGWRIVEAADGPPGLERVVQIGRVLLLLGGVSVLLIGGAGVAAAVTAHLARRTETVAVLKCLDATDGLVAAVYFAQVMLAATLGVAVGLVVGAAAPAVLGRLWPAALPFATGASVQPAALATAAAFGLVTAAAFGLWSLGRIRGIGPQRLFRDLAATVRGGRLHRAGPIAAAALLLVGLLFATTAMPVLASLFAVAAGLAVAAFLLLGRLVAWAAGRCARRGPPLLRLALNGLSRPGAVTVPVVAVLGLCLTLLVAVKTIEDNALHHLDETVPRDAPDLAFLNLSPEEGPAFAALVRRVAPGSRVERRPFLHARLTHVGDRPLLRDAVPRDVAWAVRGDRGVSWAAAPPPDAAIVAGSWWPAEHAGPPLVSVDAAVAQRLGIAVGDTIALNHRGRRLTATVANLRQIDWSQLRLDFPFLLSPPAAPPDHREIAAAWTSGPEATAALEAAVGAAFPAVATVRVGPVLERLRGALLAASRPLALIAGAAVAAAVAVIAGSLAATHRRRLRELVLLKVVGARPRQLMLAGMLELALLGLVTAAAAALLGTLAAHAVVVRIAPDGWLFRPAVPLTVAAVATAGMALAGLWLPRRALAARPAEFLRGEPAG